MDEQKFDTLMAAINKVDTRMEKIDDRLRGVEIGQAELSTKFDSQFPQIQLRLDQHVTEDTLFFHSIDEKLKPVADQSKRWSKEVWVHRATLVILAIAIGTIAPGALGAAIKLAISLFK
jgi:hypothetical protein